jgi:hypothetical protein
MQQWYARYCRIKFTFYDANWIQSIGTGQAGYTTRGGCRRSVGRSEDFAVQALAKGLSTPHLMRVGEYGSLYLVE